MASKVFDENHDSFLINYFPTKNKSLGKYWVGLDLKTLKKVDVITFCPRTDGNSIVPNEEYELFYWNNGWKSLGSKSSKYLEIKFSDVPKNALLLLKNKSGGIEERIFSYDTLNRSQVWH